jgi:hypothetical protein
MGWDPSWLDFVFCRAPGMAAKKASRLVHDPL